MQSPQLGNLKLQDDQALGQLLRAIAKILADSAINPFPNRAKWTTIASLIHPQILDG
jgi:hypothetical protein